MAATAIFAIWQHEHDKAIAADRTRFERADKDVQVAMTAIEKVYPPEQRDYAKSCRFGSHEFDKPPTDCTIAGRAIYRVDNPSEANKLTDQLSIVLRRQSGFTYKQPVAETDIFVTSFTGLFASSRNAQIRSETYLNDFSGLDCTATYEFFDPLQVPRGYLYITLRGKYNLLAELDCYGEAKAAHFPLEN